MSPWWRQRCFLLRIGLLGHAAGWGPLSAHRMAAHARLGRRRCLVFCSTLGAERSRARVVGHGLSGRVAGHTLWGGKTNPFGLRQETVVDGCPAMRCHVEHVAARRQPARRRLRLRRFFACTSLLLRWRSETFLLGLRRCFLSLSLSDEALPFCLGHVTFAVSKHRQTHVVGKCLHELAHHTVLFVRISFCTARFNLCHDVFGNPWWTTTTTTTNPSLLFTTFICHWCGLRRIKTSTGLFTTTFGHVPWILGLRLRLGSCASSEAAGNKEEGEKKAGNTESHLA